MLTAARPRVLTAVSLKRACVFAAPTLRAREINTAIRWGFAKTERVVKRIKIASIQLPFATPPVASAFHRGAAVQTFNVNWAKSATPAEEHVCRAVDAMATVQVPAADVEMWLASAQGLRLKKWRSAL